MPTQWTAPKDPDAIRDYGMDWSGDIGTATIVASSWTVNTGSVSVDSSSFTTTKTTARLVGGEPGEATSVTNHVVLSTGEEDEYTSDLEIAER